MELDFMIVKNNIQDINWAAASVFLALNLFNLLFWALGFSVSPLIYFAFLTAFLILSFKSSPNDYVIFALICFWILIFLHQPLASWDARSIWFFHAKRIFIDNNIYAQLDNYAHWSHNDYPVLIPAIAASIAKSLGFWNEYLPRLSIIFVLFPVLLVFKRLINNTFIFNIWVIGLILICKQWLFNGYMDGILALYMSASALFLIDIYSSSEFNQKNYILFFLILSTLPFIKNEGLLIQLLIFVCLVPKFFSNFKSFGYLLLSMLPYLFLWKIPVAYHHINNELFSSGLFDKLLERLNSPADLKALSGAFFSKPGKYFLVLLYFIYKFRSELKKMNAPLIFIILYTLCILFVYLITPYDLVWHLATSSGRTFLAVKMSIFSLIVFMHAKARLKI